MMLDNFCMLHHNSLLNVILLVFPSTTIHCFETRMLLRSSLEKTFFFPPVFVQCIPFVVLKLILRKKPMAFEERGGFSNKCVFDN